MSDTSTISLTHKRWLRAMVHVMCVAIILCGGAYLFGIGSDGQRPIDVRLPALQTKRNTDGSQVVQIDYAQWKTACEAVGLPDPPDMRGADPVPIEKLFDALQLWIDYQSAEALGNAGRIYQALEERHAALQCFAAANGLEPDNLLWRYHLGVECQALGYDRKAIEVFEKLSKNDRDYATTFARLGSLYFDAGELENAHRHYAAYCRLQPDISPGYIGLGRIALARNDPAEAQRQLIRATTVMPNDFLAHRFLARAFAAMGDSEHARQEAALSERLNKYSGWLAFDTRLQESHRLADSQRHLENEARLAAGRGELLQLVKVLEQLIQRRPNDHSKYRTLASVYRRLGRLEKARQAVDRGLELKPDGAAFYDIKAEIAFASDEFAKVHQWVEISRKLDPDSPRPYDLEARTLFKEGRTAVAIRAMQSAVELQPQATKTRLALVYMLRTMGRSDEAEHELRELLVIDPNNIQARRQLEGIISQTEARAIER